MLVPARLRDLVGRRRRSARRDAPQECLNRRHGGVIGVQCGEHLPRARVVHGYQPGSLTGAGIIGTVDLLRSEQGDASALRRPRRIEQTSHPVGLRPQGERWRTPGHNLLRRDLAVHIEHEDQQDKR